jgi:tetratricopeptide (TPR) repeat protein
MRPIYYTCKGVLDEQNIDSSLTPFVYRADKRHSESSDTTRFTVSTPLLESLVNGYPRTEQWSDQLREITFNRLITYYGGHNGSDINKIIDYFERTKLNSDPNFILSIANNLYFFKNYELAKQFYERGEEISLEAFSPTDLAVFCDVLAREDDYDRALLICLEQEQSSAPCKANTLTTRQTIAGIYKEQGNWLKVAEYSRKIIQCQPNHKIAQRYLVLANERAN